MNTTTLPLKDSINRASFRLALLLIPLAFACFVPAPQTRAACQDACLTNNNTVQGDDALLNLTTGTDNTAIGFQALKYNTTGSANTASGVKALFDNTTGSCNTATGFYALFSNTTGSINTGYGYSALFTNTTGDSNTAIGIAALSNMFTGSNNIGLGREAGYNLKWGSNNIYIGSVGPSSSSEDGRIRIGVTGIQKATFISGIRGVIVPGGIGVTIGTDGKLGTVVSSERFKDAVQPMDKASEAVFALRPVTFRYKKELDPDGIPQFGLVAEQVEKVSPVLVARDEQGKPYIVRYEAVNAMLLNEFLKEHRKVEQQRKDFEAALAQQQKQINALTAGLQNVSAELELRKAAAQIVVNN
jgi:trimeric autotransporter adhesin